MWNRTRSARIDHQIRRMIMSETKGKGSHAARRANAEAAKEGKSNPRTSSKAQSILGRKGARSKP